MRIRRYPGKAIDASLSLDQGNIMETIYANNWINANEIIKTKGDLHKRYDLIAATTDGASSLGKYQKTLEQIRNFNLESKDPNVTKTIKELNGYQPSTLRKKNRRQYHDWDEDSEQNLNNISANRNGESDNHVPRYEIIAYDDKKHKPAAITIDGRTKSNSTIKRSQTMRDTKSDFSKTLDVKDNLLDNKSRQRNDISYTAASRRESNTSFNCDTQSKYTPRAIESDPTTAEKYQTFNTKKPVMRAKSVRIHPSVVLYGIFNESDHDGAQFNNDLTPSSTTTPITAPVIHSSSSAGKFNTISVRNKKNAAVTHATANRFVSPTSKCNQKLTYTDIETQKYPRQSSTSSEISQQNNNNFYPSGATAAAESDETFSIPRPRLIVPVHTYARKRRTGNLHSDHMFTKADEDDDDGVDGDDTDVHINGTFTLRFTLFVLLVFFLFSVESESFAL